MADPVGLTRPDLSGEICIAKGCSQIIFNDTTGFFTTPCPEEENDLGYGLTDGIDYTDVTLVVLNIYYPTLTTPYTFTFTISAGSITDATLTDVNLNVTNIFSLLTSTVFPLENFDITLGYGVLLPELVDGIINWDYTISGEKDYVLFSYTTSDSVLSDCKVNCCIENKYLTIDPTCDCLEDKIKNIQLAEFFLNAARYAMNIGQDEKANGFITKANELCNTNCETC